MDRKFEFELQSTNYQNLNVSQINGSKVSFLFLKVKSFLKNILSVSLGIRFSTPFRCFDSKSLHFQRYHSTRLDYYGPIFQGDRRMNQLIEVQDIFFKGAHIILLEFFYGIAVRFCTQRSRFIQSQGAPGHFIISGNGSYLG